MKKSKKTPHPLARHYGHCAICGREKLMESLHILYIDRKMKLVCGACKAEIKESGTSTG